MKKQLDGAVTLLAIAYLFGWLPAAMDLPPNVQMVINVLGGILYLYLIIPRIVQAHKFYIDTYKSHGISKRDALHYWFRASPFKSMLTVMVTVGLTAALISGVIFYLIARGAPKDPSPSVPIKEYKPRPTEPPPKDTVSDADKESNPNDSISIHDFELLHEQIGRRLEAGPNAYIQLGKSYASNGVQYQDVILSGEGFGIWSKATGRPFKGEPLPPGLSMPEFAIEALLHQKGVNFTPHPTGAIIVHFPLRKDAVFSLTHQGRTVDLILKSFSERSVSLRVEVRKPNAAELKALGTMK